MKTEYAKSDERGKIESDAELAKLASALGHPMRIAILRFLLREGVCICGEIVASLPLAQSTTSQHLKVLREAGWIRGEIEGPRSCYCLEPRAFEKFRELWGEFSPDEIGQTGCCEVDL